MAKHFAFGTVLIKKKKKKHFAALALPLPCPHRDDGSASTVGGVGALNFIDGGSGMLDGRSMRLILRGAAPGLVDHGDQHPSPIFPGDPKVRRCGSRGSPLGALLVSDAQRPAANIRKEARHTRASVGIPRIEMSQHHLKYSKHVHSNLGVIRCVRARLGLVSNHRVQSGCGISDSDDVQQRKSSFIILEGVG